MDFSRDNKTISALEKNIKNADYLEITKELLFQYESELFVSGVVPSTVRNNLVNMHMLAKINPIFDFSQPTKTDILHLLTAIEKSQYSAATKNKLKVNLKKFYKWMGMPDIEDLVVVKNRNQTRKIPEELLTSDEIKKMLDAATHPRDKAMVAILYDSGARVGEIGTMQIKHVTFDQYGAVAILNGKTGMRRVRLIFSAPYIAAWLDIHPKKNDQESYLWLSYGRNTSGNPLTYEGFLKSIQSVAKKARIKKRVYPHLFRHSRATEFANHLTESQMNAHLGWVPNSNMAATYVHLSGKQVDDALLKMHGIVKEEDTKPQLTAMKCPRCGHLNGPTSNFCAKCSMTLNIEAAMNAEDTRAGRAMKVMEIISKNPELLAILKDLE